MSLIINKVSSASLQVNYSYLESDLIFGYEVSATYTVDFTDITFTNGANVLFEGIEALRLAYQQQNLVARIGGDEFIYGRIQNQSFEESYLVGSSKCTIVIEESKRLEDYSENEFAQQIPSPQWIESFSETFSFSRSGESYSSTRNVSLKYKQDTGDQFLSKAKIFLRNFYYSFRPNLGYHIDGISENGRTDGGFRPLITETFDLLGLSVSIQENLETSLIVNNYSKTQSYSEALTKEGFSEKQYTIEIKALKEPLELVANDACKAVLNAIVAANSAAYKKPIEITKTINKDGGIISLNLSFSNNPSLNDTNIALYTLAKSRQACISDYTLDVDISSEGKNAVEKDSNAKAFWQSQISSYVSRVAAPTDIFEKSRNITFTKTKGKIKDSVTYTDDDAYDSASLPSGLIKFKTETTISSKVERSQPFIDVVDNTEKIETTGLDKMGSKVITLTAVALKSKGEEFAKDYLLGISAPLDGYINSDSVTNNSEGEASRVISFDIIQS